MRTNIAAHTYAHTLYTSEKRGACTHAARHHRAHNEAEAAPQQGRGLAGGAVAKRVQENELVAPGDQLCGSHIVPAGGSGAVEETEGEATGGDKRPDG